MWYLHCTFLRRNAVQQCSGISISLLLLLKLIHSSGKNIHSFVVAKWSYLLLCHCKGSSNVFLSRGRIQAQLLKLIKISDNTTFCVPSSRAPPKPKINTFDWYKNFIVLYDESSLQLRCVNTTGHVQKWLFTFGKKLPTHGLCVDKTG